MQNEVTAVIIVVVTVTSVVWLNRQEIRWIRAILDWFPAILFAYVIPALFTHVFSLELKTVYLHSLSKDWIIPFAVLTVMSALPYRQLRIVGIKPIVLFVSGSFCIAVLPVILVYLSGLLSADHHQLFMDQEYWKGLVPIVGGWIGGSTSQLVLKELVGTEEGLFLSVLVLDNILVNIWTLLMFQFIQKSDRLNQFFGIKDDMKLMTPDEGMSHSTFLPPLATAGVIVLITLVVNLLVSSFLWKIIILSFIGLALGNLIRRWNVNYVLKTGGLAIILIMAILGLKLDFSKFSLPPVLVMLVITWLVSHYLFMFFTALFLRLNTAWLPIASMANLGGISTAPAVTSAYKKELMPHAILLAILSMVTGTAWGMFTIFLFEKWM